MEQSLRKIGDLTAIQTVQPVSGGEISQAYYVKTEQQAYFIKTNQGVTGNFFKVEADGLERIRATGTIAVPEVYYYDETIDNQEMVLILEWIQGETSATTAQQLGKQIAALHLAPAAPHYGMEHPTFVGELIQPNKWYDNWINYFHEQRLLPQLDLAIQQKRMPHARRAKLETLLNRLDRYLPSHPRVSLLHGDLWGGNWLAGPHGKPYVIDPSVVYGDHLFELAFTELFHRFPDDFYSHYQTLLPIADYYQEVKPIYQLFYLLVHLNIFGEGYGSSVDQILKKYAG